VWEKRKILLSKGGNCAKEVFIYFILDGNYRLLVRNSIINKKLKDDLPNKKRGPKSFVLFLWRMEGLSPEPLRRSIGGGLHNSLQFAYRRHLSTLICKPLSLFLSVDNMFDIRTPKSHVMTNLLHKVMNIRKYGTRPLCMSKDRSLIIFTKILWLHHNIFHIHINILWG
jgi:hypothetical protein